jgi:cyclase
MQHQTDHHHHPHHHHEEQPPSRRDFFRTVMGSALAGASILELARCRAAWAQALATTANPQLFDIEKVAEGVYFARARPAAVGNCNAGIFVNSADVLVVDAHSKPSAAASLIAQIKREVTVKPVRYLVDTHFHWDHAQGNAAYREAGAKILASNKTKQLLMEFSGKRLYESLDPNGHSFPSQPHIPAILEAARTRLASATSEEERARIEGQIRELEAFTSEMKDYSPVLPTVTFDNSYVIKDKAHDLHLEFHGRAHTAGDVQVFCPQKRVVATGDMILGSTPFIADGYPKEWPASIDSVSKLDFDYVMPGHGGVQQGRQRMNDLRNYIEELTAKVGAGKKQGQTVADLQKSITVASLKSLQRGDYAEFLSGRGGNPSSLQSRVSTNVGHIYLRLDAM